MHRWGDVRTSITRLNVYQPSKPQRKLWIWRYLTEDESISLWLPVNLESFVQHPFVIWGRRQMEQRERQAPARLAAKLTPDPLLFLHELQDCITCSPSNQSRQITSLSAAELTFLLTSVTFYPVLFDIVAICPSQTANVQINGRVTLIKTVDECSLSEDSD